MFRKFLPQEFNFFDLFEKQVNFAVEAAKTFRAIVGTPGPLTELSYQKIRELEHQGDDAAHTIIDQLNKTFITPFDREDIHALTKELDDIVDMINTISNRMMVYKIAGGDKDLMEFSRVIEESVVAVASAVKGLRTMKNAECIRKACVEVNRLENVGDSMRDAVLGRLFETSHDPVEIIKWKEIYEDAETLLDICEDVAHVVESILVKQA
jgi:hypothetical protein